MEYFSDTYLIALLLFLIVVSGFFSGSEIAMMALNRYRLQHLVKLNHRSAQVAQRLLERKDRLLGVILIGNTFANIVASSVATIFAVKLLGDYGVVVASIALTLIVLIFAEVIPKTIAALNPLRLALIVCWPLTALLFIMYPLVWLVSLITNNLLRLVGIKLGHGQTEHLSTEELHTVVREASALVPEIRRNMLLRIFELQEVTVDTIMIPRSEIIGIDLNDEWDSILQQLESSQHTRLPLFCGTIDDVRGIVHLRDVLAAKLAGTFTKENLIEMAYENYFVPEGTSLHTQLLNFQKAKCRTGLVVDEYGDLQGLVTLEDILEEIVGDFTTNIAALNQEIFPQEDGSFFVDGSVTLRELNRTMEWRLPEEGPKTLSGLLVETLEYIPPVGTTVKIAGYPIEIIQMHKNRVKIARIDPTWDE